MTTRPPRALPATGTGKLAEPRPRATVHSVSVMRPASAFRDESPKICEVHASDIRGPFSNLRARRDAKTIPPGFAWAGLSRLRNTGCVSRSY
jgi:hypothetical protein